VLLLLIANLEVAEPFLFCILSWLLGPWGWGGYGYPYPPPPGRYPYYRDSGVDYTPKAGENSKDYIDWASHVGRGLWERRRGENIGT
ncbi:hypothetical protein PENTCL1PPCAC_9178, partial [Pristionchus entomophagus]